MAFDVHKIRQDFPTLHQKINGSDFVYLDNGATAQKPKAVINAVNEFYTNYNSNIHRGIHHLSQVATERYEQTRGKTQHFINAKKEEEIIFTSGTTESINLVAQTYGRVNLMEGDEVLISGMEHHSNIVPWQLLCEERNASLQVIPVTDTGELDLESFDLLLSEKTKMVAIAHVSNTLGTINPVKQIIEKSQEVGAVVLLDGAQAVPHYSVDVQNLDCDFYAFSAHKMFGPTGVGVLYGKEELLNEMPPYKGGGDMIKTVTFEKTVYNDLPHKFEAGTPNIAGGIGLGAALDYLNELDPESVQTHEDVLLQKATNELQQIDGLRIIGASPHKVPVISMVVDGTHPTDIGTLLDQQGIAVRTGHHCTEPLMNRFEIPGTTRASFAFYNTLTEVDRLVEGMAKAVKMLRG